MILRPAQDELSRVAMDLTADRLEEEFDATANDATRLLAALRDWTQLGTTDLKEPDDIVRVAMSQLLNRPHMLNVLFARADGIGLIVGKSSRGFLVRMIDHEQAPGRQRWLHYDVAGRLLGEEFVARDYDPRERSWFKGAMRTEFGGTYWTDPYLFFETRDPGLTISTALEPAPGGDPLVIGLDLTVRGISALTMQYRLGQSGGMALLTEEGRVLGQPYGADHRRSESMAGGLLPCQERWG